MTERRRGARSAVVTMLYGRRPADRERRHPGHPPANPVPVPHPPTAAPPPGDRPAEPLASSAGSPRASSRPGRLAASRPLPAARRARWVGTPLVPLLTAALVATAFLAVRGGGENDGNPMGAPPPVVTEDTTPPATGAGRSPDAAGASGGGTTDTPTPGTTRSGAPATAAARGGTPVRTEPADRSPRSSTSPTPSRTGSTAPTRTTPAPSGGSRDERRSGRPVSFEALRVGDCFDIDRATPGTAVRRPCDTPHSAELVARPRLVGRYATDRAVREAAAELCREPLRRKAARQPLGTHWTTFVQYPYRTSHLLGSDTVACSLAAPSSTGGTISHRLG
ncbi:MULTISPECIES: hypothetical protein [unclassified Streptomyces]|uniref:hypothetical protein n=1 Tax=unclassified Streptomyces TaxID=2593676 RepID=UPI0006AF33D8|nr:MULTISPECIES: hypothetical protein [unclassified Streptomyces]